MQQSTQTIADTAKPIKFDVLIDTLSNTLVSAALPSNLPAFSLTDPAILQFPELWQQGWQDWVFE
jgi:hypothetical protein